MALRWAIIGAGAIAEKCVAGAMINAPNSSLEMAMRRDAEKLRDFARRWGVGRYTTDLDEVLGDDGIDAVYIATPIYVHKEETIKAAEAGKHVLVEKPMAMTSEECQEMIDACAKNKVKLGVAFYQRFNQRHQKMQEWIAAGKIGQVIGARIQFGQYYPEIEGAWRQIPEQGGGGTIMDTGSHCLDTLRALLGAEVEEVVGFMDTLVFSYPVDDTTSFILRFDNGAHGVVTTFWSTPDVEHFSLNIVDVYGTKGRVVASPINAKNSEGFLKIYRADEWNEFYGDQNTHIAMLEDFVKAVEEDREPGVPGREGMINMKILEAVMESAKTGRAVKVE